MEHHAYIEYHYASVWRTPSRKIVWPQGPMATAFPAFHILAFPPVHTRKHWVYATCGMSALESAAIELHLLSATQDESLAALLTAIAYYHLSSDQKLDLGHTINLGRAWKPGSVCRYGLVSLPYLDGPSLENCSIEGMDTPIKCYWLIPISAKERAYKISNGLDALETAFENTRFSYLDPYRRDVV